METPQAHNPVEIPIGKVIENYLAKNHIRHSDFAKKVGISTSTLSRTINTHTAVQPRTWEKIKAAYPDIFAPHVSTPPVPIPGDIKTGNEVSGASGLANDAEILCLLVSNANGLTTEEIREIINWAQSPEARRILDGKTPKQIIAALLAMLAKSGALAAPAANGDTPAAPQPSA